MQSLILRCIIAIVFFSIGPAVDAKDGLIFADVPPITLLFGGSQLNGDLFVSFTNTSDTIIHAVVITADTEGKKKSATIIDTILPHKTVTMSAVEFAKIIQTLGSKHYKELSITCKDFSKPLEIKEWWRFNTTDKK